MYKVFKVVLAIVYACLIPALIRILLSLLENLMSLPCPWKLKKPLLRLVWRIFLCSLEWDKKMKAAGKAQKAVRHITNKEVQ